MFTVCATQFRRWPVHFKIIYNYSINLRVNACVSDRHGDVVNNMPTSVRERFCVQFLVWPDKIFHVPFVLTGVCGVPEGVAMGSFMFFC